MPSIRPSIRPAIVYRPSSHWLLSAHAHAHLCLFSSIVSSWIKLRAVGRSASQSVSQSARRTVVGFLDFDACVLLVECRTRNCRGLNGDDATIGVLMSLFMKHTHTHSSRVHVCVRARGGASRTLTLRHRGKVSRQLTRSFPIPNIHGFVGTSQRYHCA